MPKGESVPDVLKKMVHGVTVVGILDQKGKSDAFTAAWVSQVSAAPPLLAVAVRKSGRFHDALRKAGSFTVSLLAAGQGEIARSFGRVEGGGKALRLREGKPPLVADCIAFLECSLESILTPGGDHDLFVGKVTGGETVRGGEPMLLHAEKGLAYPG